MRLVKRPRARGGPLLPSNPLVRAFIRAADELHLGEEHVTERNHLLSTMLDTCDCLKRQPPDWAEKMLFEIATEQYRFGFPPAH